jgi:C-terminal processing protease CtpA/Prc
VFGVLASGLGYVDLARLTPALVDEMFKAIAPTPGTIFDMRGYPNGTAWSIAPRLTRRASVVSSQFEGPLVDGRGRADPALRHARQAVGDLLPPATGAPYLGKVVMLVDPRTQSQAESTALMFEAATDVTFIGSPSAGANGDVTEFVLPGGLSASFSGHDVRHADGRQLQRVGILPQVVVTPTIAGMVAGRDEVLEAALAWLAAHPPAAAPALARP